MPDQIKMLKDELSRYEEMFNSDELTSEQKDDISKKISRIKIKLFLYDVRENSDDS